MKVNSYILNYEKSCNELVLFFAQKYELSVSKEGWVAGVVGGTICVNDEFYLNMEDIVLMLKEDISWTAFLEWWDYNMDAHYLGLNAINLRSWIKGAPRLTKEQIEGLKGKRKELDELVEKYNSKY